MCYSTFRHFTSDTRIENGEKVCNIKYYCDATLADVGTKLFFRIFYGWICYNAIQLFSSVCFTIAADRQVGIFSNNDRKLDTNFLELNLKSVFNFL